MTKPSDNTIRAGFDDVAELATRLRAHVSIVDAHGRDVVSRMFVEQADGVKAASYGGTGQARMWCWLHERDLSICHKPENNFPCSGERIDWQDPTGDTAVVPDATAVDRQALDQQLRIAKTALEKAENITAKYPPAHAPSLFDLEATDGCQSCARVGEFSKVHGTRELAPGETRRLCHWCGWDWLPRYECLPPIEVVRAHLDGGRIYVREDGTVVHQGNEIAKVDNIRAGQR